MLHIRKNVKGFSISATSILATLTGIVLEFPDCNLKLWKTIKMLLSIIKKEGFLFYLTRDVTNKLIDMWVLVVERHRPEKGVKMTVN